MTEGMLCHSFIDFIINETVRKNSNCIIFIGGKSGKGKSYASMKIGEMINKRFLEMGLINLDDEHPTYPFDVSNVIWNIKDLVKAIRNEKCKDFEIDGFIHEGNKLRKGSVVVIEEAGVNANSREWHSVTNQALHFLSQTYRRNNFTTIFNAPDMSFVDVGVRKTVHIFLKAIKVVQGQYAEFEIQVPTSDNYGDLTFESFWVYDEINNMKYPVKYLRFELPEKKMVNTYEKLKKRFNDALYAKLDAQIGAMDRKMEKDLLKGET